MRVAGVQRFEVEVDTVETGIEDLPRGVDHGGAGRTPFKVQTSGSLRGEYVPEPGLHPDAGQGAMHGIDQPPRLRVAGRGQCAVVLQRSRMDVQVLDPRPTDPVGERGQVPAVLAPVDPGVPEPDGITAAGTGAGARVAGVVEPQGDTGGEQRNHDHQDESQRDPPRPGPPQPIPAEPGRPVPHRAGHALHVRTHSGYPLIVGVPWQYDRHDVPSPKDRCRVSGPARCKPPGGDARIPARAEFIGSPSPPAPRSVAWSVRAIGTGSSRGTPQRPCTTSAPSSASPAARCVPRRLPLPWLPART